MIFVHLSHFIYEIGARIRHRASSSIIYFFLYTTLPHEFAGSAWICGGRGTNSAYHVSFPGLRHSQRQTREMDILQWCSLSERSGWVDRSIDNQPVQPRFAKFQLCPKCQNSRQRDSYKAMQWQCSYKDHAMKETAEDAMWTQRR